MKKLNSQQIGKYFTIINCCNWRKKNFHTKKIQIRHKTIHSPEAYLLIQSKVISFIKANKSTSWIFKNIYYCNGGTLYWRFTKFIKTINKTKNKKTTVRIFWTLAVLENFNLHSVLYSAFSKSTIMNINR